jgi:hypothetical protein
MYLACFALLCPQVTIGVNHFATYYLTSLLLPLVSELA